MAGPGPFKYVFIPADANTDMSELTFTEPVTLEDDLFNKHIKTCLATSSTGEVSCIVIGS